MDIPEAWTNYVSNNPYGFDSPYLEITRSVLWDTERYKGGGNVTPPTWPYGIRFFETVKTRRREGNLYYPGMLPNPTSFLVEQMQIKGLTRLLAKNAILTFIIGQKMYLEIPLDMFVRHQKFFDFYPKLMIGPLQYFTVLIHWPIERYNGGDQPKIEVSLRGQMARPIQ